MPAPAPAAVQTPAPVAARAAPAPHDLVDLTGQSDDDEVLSSNCVSAALPGTTAASKGLALASTLHLALMHVAHFCAGGHDQRHHPTHQAGDGAPDGAAQRSQQVWGVPPTQESVLTSDFSCTQLYEDERLERRHM